MAGERTGASERTVSDAIESALGEGWRPGGEFTPEHYTWGFVPCPDCGEAMMLGVHDPDEQIEADEKTFVVMRPPE